MKPRSPHPDDNGYRRGISAEDRLLKELCDARHVGIIDDFGKPDAIVIAPSPLNVLLVEAKGQEVFKGPPWDGHGLPIDQANRYEEIRRQTGLRTLLVVYDDGRRWTAWLDELEAGKRFDTIGSVKTPRRIYPLESFHRSEHYLIEWRHVQDRLREYYDAIEDERQRNPAGRIS